MLSSVNINKLLDDLRERYPNHCPQLQKNIIIINIREQMLYLINNRKIIASYIISTAEKGTDNKVGSFKTPLGVHCITEKIGENATLGSIFKARQNTHERATILNGKHETSNADNITSRILWLSGLEDGVNKGGDVDSHDRYIYIHGTDEEGRLGQPVSHGCIRMKNSDVIELFDLTPLNIWVNIIQ
ncbi:MAG: L,D-transpeptidase [Cocleimonas sp.]